MAPQASTPPESGGAAFSFPVREAQRALSEKGAYVVEDAAAGRRVDDFINAKQLPLRKVDGLAFCAQNSFYDKNMKAVIESSLHGPHWGLAKLYNSAVLPSDTAVFFADGPAMRSLFILLFMPNTRFLYFAGSHRERVPGKAMSKFGLLALQHDTLEAHGCARVACDMAQGGFAIIDGRVGWTILKGQQIAIGYASEDEIAFWADIELGDTVPLRDKVAELHDQGVKAKFRFVPPPNVAPADA